MKADILSLLDYLTLGVVVVPVAEDNELSVDDGLLYCSRIFRLYHIGRSSAIYMTIDLEIQYLHAILRGSLGAPETYITHFLAVSQVIAKDIVIAIVVNTFLANIVVCKAPISVVCREINVVFL